MGNTQFSTTVDGRGRWTFNSTSLWNIEVTLKTALPQERRNKDIVHVLMVKTFADRRHMLVNEFKHLREIIEKYPLLRSKDQVRTHFNAFSKYGVRRDKPEKGVDVEMGGCNFLNYFTVQSHLLFVGKVKFPSRFSPKSL